MTIGQLAQMNSIYKSLQANNQRTNTSLNKLASGYGINSAADNAAGLGISQRMQGQIGGLNMAVQNATNAVSLVQTAEGGLESQSGMLNRMRELAVQASNGTYSDSERAMINQEFQDLRSEIDKTSSATQYNGRSLLDGGEKGFETTFQVGANGDGSQLMTLNISDMSAKGLGLDKLDLTTADNAAQAVTAIDKAINAVSDERANLGATQNRLTHSIDNLTNAAYNTQASESSIRGLDMAEELVNHTRNRIMQQASVAMMAQGMNMARSYTLGLLMR